MTPTRYSSTPPLQDRLGTLGERARALAERLGSLSDPLSPAFGAVSAAAVGALSLVDPARLSRSGRHWYRAASAALGGFAVAATIDRDGTALVPARAFAGVAAAGAVYALADASEDWDRRLSGALSSRGVRHPRRWMAAGAAALMVVSYLGDRALDSSAGHEEEDDAGAPLERDVDPALSSLVEALLRAGGGEDAELLLDQLGRARELVWDGGAFSTVAEFEVPQDEVRVVPHSQEFPVRGRWFAPGGEELELVLRIEDGRLAYVAVDLVGESELPIDELIDAWPAPADVELLRDAPDGRTRL
ncbi:hypothetical protein ACQ3I4_08865 [Zafaria sp. Z1313]|uniref:hypothetical protein n=1 Tax=Zafaria sp. Z1313 TaxID=3423202 RepID=UPI003D301A28